MKTEVRYSDIHPLLGINLKNITDDGPAYMTHYFHTSFNGISNLYKPGAERFLNELKIHSRIDNDRSLDKCIPQKWDKLFYPPLEEHTFRFIDLFAGVGGFRVAMQNLGGRCVFSSEKDPFAKMTYYRNFGEVPFGDITEFTKGNISARIPKHQILCAGFPCQAFSIAGRRGGFKDTRGTLFFHVAKIIKELRPEAFFLENVKGLRSHDGGKTLDTILNTLRGEELGYHVPDPQIINAKNFGVPQNRERVFIIGFKSEEACRNFKFATKSKHNKATFGDVKEKEPVAAKYYLSQRYLNTLKKHKQRHADKGNGFGYEIIPDDGIANAIVVGGMGRERNLVKDDRLKDFTPQTNIQGEINREGIRRMTPLEWARLQGFKKGFRPDQVAVSDAQLYKQLGNSVAVPAIQANANVILKALGIPSGRQ